MYIMKYTHTILFIFILVYHVNTYVINERRDQTHTHTRIPTIDIYIKKDIYFIYIEISRRALSHSTKLVTHPSHTRYSTYVTHAVTHPVYTLIPSPHHTHTLVHTHTHTHAHTHAHKRAHTNVIHLVIHSPKDRYVSRPMNTILAITTVNTTRTGNQLVSLTVCVVV